MPKVPQPKKKPTKKSKVGARPKLPATDVKPDPLLRSPRLPGGPLPADVLDDLTASDTPDRREAARRHLESERAARNAGATDLVDDRD